MDKQKTQIARHNNPFVVWGLKALMRNSPAPIRKELPPAQYDEIISEECEIPMSDGVKLHASLRIPEKGGKFPVILIRNPYANTNLMWLAVLPVFAEQGYAVVLVNVRGTIDSEGEWIPFVHEREDGRDVIDWIADQPWCDGNIGAFGASYLGHSQWAIADYHHPALKTLFISVYGAAPYNTFYRRGMFRQEIWTQWAAQMMENNRYKLLLSPKLVPRALSYKPQIRLGECLKEKPCAWYNDWISNTEPNDSYWSDGFWGEFEKAVKNIDIPIFLHGGWFDIFLRPQLEAFRNLPDDVRRKSRFLIGPWNHGGSPVGDIKFPNQAVGDFLFVKPALEWFDTHLKGKPYSKPVGVVEAYDIGSGCWKTFEKDITAQEEVSLYLAGNQKLEAVPGKGGEIDFIFNPEKAVPSLGGNMLGSGGMSAPGGVKRQPPVGARADVISFVSDPLEQSIHITGKIQADLYVASDAPATAFTVTVSEVNTNGDCYNICDDITDIRWRDETTVKDYTPGEVVKLHIELLDVVWTTKHGSRIRLDISSSNFPMYHVHPNTDKPWAEQTATRKAKQNVYFGEGTPSKIIIPVEKPRK